MRPHKMKRNPITSEFIEVVEVKAVVGGSSSGMSGPSTSRNILAENRANGSENRPNTPPGAPQGQADLGRVLDSVQNQARALEHYGASIRMQCDTLKQQQDISQKHSLAIVKLLKEQQTLRDHVEEEFGRQGSILQQHETELKVIRGRVEKLCKSHRGNGNSNLRRSTRLEASRIQQAPPTSGIQVKHHPVECSYCGITFSSSYIYKHAKKCPALVQVQQGFK